MQASPAWKEHHMKVFTPDNSFKGRFNYVDKNNVLVGFDMNPDCCENFGSKITDTLDDIKNAPEIPDSGMEPYVFDTRFRQDNLYPDTDSGGSVTFKLTARGRKPRYLTFWNHHNGYYSHGFHFMVDGKVIHDESL